MARRSKLLAGLALALALLGALKLRGRLWARLFGLAPARFRVRATRDIAVPMADGVALLADHYAPVGAGSCPTILIRTPYGKGREAGPFGLVWGFFARRMAERGYHVVVQLTRGRFGSGGVFDPLVSEAADGRATLAWLREQPWFSGSLATWGASYLGYTQWALAADAGPLLKAMLPIVTGAQLGSLTQLDGAFGFDTLLNWAAMTDLLGGESRRRPTLWQNMRTPALVRRRVGPAFQHLPLAGADQQVVGRTVEFYQDWLNHTDLRGPYWQQRDHTARVHEVTAAVHLLSGWYDLIQRELLADYAALHAAGRAPYLTIGPWAHTDPGLIAASLREGLRWFDQHLKGAPALPRRPVRLFVMGANRWREFAAWPPPARATPLYLHGGGQLAWDRPAASAPSRYRYDPADPTPAIGGARLPADASGPRDQRALEARADLLCFTSAVLEADVEVIGPVRLVLYVRSSLEYTDMLGRLCDMYPDGRSINLCDGLLRVAPGVGERQPDGSLRLEIGLWNTANRFRRGHRIRLHVASGAHPRWSRNLGLGEPLAAATRMCAAEQTVYHDLAHPAALLLPVVE